MVHPKRPLKLQVFHRGFVVLVDGIGLKLVDGHGRKVSFEIWLLTTITIVEEVQMMTGNLEVLIRLRIDILNSCIQKFVIDTIQDIDDACIAAFGLPRRGFERADMVMVEVVEEKRKVRARRGWRFFFRVL